jgi:hypothetical protein
MENKLTKIFKKAKYEPEANLAFSIWHTIITKEKRLTRFKSWSFGFIGLTSLAGLVPAFQILLNDLAHSGFYEYFSLLFSDGGSMLTYWKELALSLAESLPTMSIIFTLSLFFVCFLSLKYLVKQIFKNQLTDSAVLSLSV